MEDEPQVESRPRPVSYTGILQDLLLAALPLFLIWTWKFWVRAPFEMSAFFFAPTNHDSVPVFSIGEIIHPYLFFVFFPVLLWFSRRGVRQRMDWAFGFIFAGLASYYVWWLGWQLVVGPELVREPLRYDGAYLYALRLRSVATILVHGWAAWTLFFDRRSAGLAILATIIVAIINIVWILPPNVAADSANELSKEILAMRRLPDRYIPLPIGFFSLAGLPGSLRFFWSLFLFKFLAVAYCYVIRPRLIREQEGESVDELAAEEAA